MKRLVMMILLVGICQFCKSQQEEDELDAAEVIQSIQKKPSSQRSPGDEARKSGNDKGSVSGCTVFELDYHEKESLANLHNYLRRQVAKGYETQGYKGKQPMAANMHRMIYDLELEFHANKFAEKCDPSFEEDFEIEGFHSVMKSVFYETSSTDYLPPFNLSYVIEDYYKRMVKRFNGDDAINPFHGINSITGEDMRSYAILVNHDTKALGCSHATFFDTKKHKYVRLSSCYYANGLVDGQPLYHHGEPCSDVHRRDCDDGLVILESGLTRPLPGQLPSHLSISEMQPWGVKPVGMKPTGTKLPGGKPSGTAAGYLHPAPGSLGMPSEYVPYPPPATGHSVRDGKPENQSGQKNH